MSFTLDDGRTAYNMVATADRQATGGDSGGPWYDEGKAFGVHSGSVVLDGARRDVFTPAFHIDNGLPQVSSVRTQ